MISGYIETTILNNSSFAELIPRISVDTPAWYVCVNNPTQELLYLGHMDVLDSTLRIINVL